MKRNYSFVMLLMLLLSLSIAAAYGAMHPKIDRTTIKNLDLNSFMGLWYEIARFDHSFERDMKRVSATYTLLDDGRIEVINRGIRNGKQVEAIGKAKLGKKDGQLRVSFFWFFYADYNILEMGNDGSWALVGSHSPNYLWILSRTPTLPDATIDHIVALAKQRGYQVDKLIFEDSFIE